MALHLVELDELLLVASELVDGLLVNLVVLNLLDHPPDQIVLDLFEIVKLALSPPAAELLLLDDDVLGVLMTMTLRFLAFSLLATLFHEQLDAGLFNDVLALETCEH